MAVAAAKLKPVTSMMIMNPINSI